MVNEIAVLSKEPGHQASSPAADLTETAPSMQQAALAQFFPHQGAVGPGMIQGRHIQRVYGGKRLAYGILRQEINRMVSVIITGYV
jgi:hypothetical protein